MELGIEQCRGILPRGGTILGSSAPTRSRSTAASSGSRTTSPRDGVDALVAIGGEDTLGVATKLADLGVNVVGVPEDHRQRPVRHRLHLRLRHRGQHRDRGDRPAAHHRRVAPPGARRRGDGPARRLDRPARRHRRRRQHRADPRAALRHRRRSASYVEKRFETQYAPIIVVSEGAVPSEGGDMTLVSGEKSTRSATSGSAASATGWPARSRQRTGKEARAVVLGHIQRGGTPDGVRPLAGHPLRAARHRRGRRRRLRHDGGAARHRHRPGPADRGHRRAQAGQPERVRRGRGLLRLSASPRGRCVHALRLSPPAIWAHE